MDYKVKGYQSFQGEFLRTDVKISQKLIDLMDDDDLMLLRATCSKFESELFNICNHYAFFAVTNEIAAQQAAQQANEKTNPETNPQTNPETDKKH